VGREEAWGWGLALLTMSFQITTAFVEQYNSTVEHLFQQTTSELENRVRRESQNGAIEYFDQMGATYAVRRTVRHGDTPRIDSKHYKCACYVDDWEWSDLIDKQDRVRLLHDPLSEYLQSAVWAFQRVKDETLVDAATGVAFRSNGPGSGAPFSVSLPASQSLAVNFVTQGPPVTSGLTIEKLTRAKTLLSAANVPKGAPRYFVCTEYQIEDLLLDAERNSDSPLTEIRALHEGKINKLMGFEFVTIDPSIVKRDPSTGIRECFAYVKPALILSTGQEIESDVSKRADKSNAVQPYVSMSVGATRTQEKGVVQVFCEDNS